MGPGQSLVTSAATIGGDEESGPVAFAGLHQFKGYDREAGDRRAFLTRASPLVSGLTDRYVSFVPGILPGTAIILIADFSIN